MVGEGVRRVGVGKVCDVCGEDHEVVVSRARH
jgi:hypothetical protein